MNIRTSTPPYLKKPLLRLVVSMFLYSILVVAAFAATSDWLISAAEWRPYLAAVPGVVLCGYFPIQYLYLKHSDELAREIMTKSLAVGCVAGLSVHIVSISRAAIAGYEQFDGATVIVAIALSFLCVSTFLSWKHR